MVELLTRRYLANVHRYPLGVALEGVAVWSLVWLAAHRATMHAGNDAARIR